MEGEPLVIAQGSLVLLIGLEEEHIAALDKTPSIAISGINVFYNVHHAVGIKELKEERSATRDNLNSFFRRVK